MFQVRAHARCVRICAVCIHKEPIDLVRPRKSARVDGAGGGPRQGADERDGGHRDLAQNVPAQQTRRCLQKKRVPKKEEVGIRVTTA